MIASVNSDAHRNFISKSFVCQRNVVIAKLPHSEHEKTGYYQGHAIDIFSRFLSYMLTEFSPEEAK